MAELREHGGRCCGINHIEFFYGDVETVAREVDHCIRDFSDGQETERDDGSQGVPQGALEAVLTDGQVREYGKLLKERGFQRVFRFKNSNSGNYCNVFYKSFGQPRGKSALKAPEY